MTDPERELEIHRLAAVMHEIQTQLAIVTGNHAKAQSELGESLSDYWENTYTDFWDEAQFIETVARQRSITAASYRRHLQLKKLSESAYFGRIDFKEEFPNTSNKAEPIYIGVATLTDRETKSLLVYDWRSPIAGMFYDFERGKASYPSPGGTITGTITLKRQFKIIHGQIEYMFDSDLKIDDEILQEILSKSADSKMRTIITSIQREQNQAIRDEQHRILLVQGPAGSGKTSIALHRIAYLLYRERNSLTAKSILIFSPNRIFSDYISNVLPELGEENVVQTTFQDYITRALSKLGEDIEEKDSQLEYLYQCSRDSDYHLRTVGINYKSSAIFAKTLIKYLDEIQAQIANYPTITFNGTIIMTKDEWATLFSKTISYLSVAKRLAQLRRMIQIRLRPLIHQLRKEEEEKIAATGEEVNERVIKALARIAVKGNTEAFLTEIKNRTEVDPLILYKRLFKDISLFKHLAGEQEIPSNWQQICNMTLNAINSGQVFYEDSLPLLFFQGCLEGFSTRAGIRHLVIDEAQDYTLLHYEILKRLFPNCSWTILGDPAQSIHPCLNPADLDQAAQILSDNESNDNSPVKMIRLQRSYRSTYEIQTFTLQILGSDHLGDPIQRSGKLPEIIHVEKPHDLEAAIIQKIGNLRQEGRKSVAIICKTSKEATAVYNRLNPSSNISLITPETIEFKRGIVVVPVYLAKGLEFDGVIIYNANNETYSSEADRNILYTACTRALHHLVLYYTGNLSKLLRRVDQTTYIQP